MKCRAKPKFVLPSDFEEPQKSSYLEKNKVGDCELYFDSGRNALTFLLKYVKAKRVGTQSFNCVAVFDAIKKANCQPVLFDIKLSDFSIGIEVLKKEEAEIDVLIVTHYQGIPNLDYIEIIEYCMSKGIVVIEDMSQTFGAEIDGVKVGSLGNYCIHSFAIDKPFTCFEGGALSMKTLDERMIYLYSKLPLENVKKGRLDIKRVQFYDLFFDEEHYFEGLDNRRNLWVVLLKYISVYWVYKIMKVNFISAFLYRVVQKIQKKSTSNDIFRLGYQKINLVVLQRGRFDECNNENAIDLMKKYLIKLPVNLCRNGVRINWNRLSVLDETGTLSKVLKENSIDCNNYNWPVPLHLLAGVDKEGRYKGKMDNSELASKAILNIPCW